MSAKRFALWAVLLGTVLWLLDHFFLAPAGILKPDAPVAIILTIGGITCLLYYFLMRPADPRSFTTNYLLSLVLKMVTFLGLIGILAFLSPKSLTENTVFGFLTYVVFTVLEVWALYRYKSRA